MFVLVVCYCVWHPSIGDMLLLFLLQLLLLKYYPEGKDVECLALNSYLKREPDLKDKCWFILFELVIRRSCLNLLKYSQCVHD